MCIAWQHFTTLVSNKIWKHTALLVKTLVTCVPLLLMVLCWTAGTPAFEKSGWPPLRKLAGCLCSCVTVYLTVSVPRAALQMDTPAVAMLVSGGVRFSAGCL